MMRGMDAAISGLEAHQTMLDVTANNLANVDTIGYKAQRTTFTDELSQLVGPTTAPNSYNGGTNAKQIGLGVQVGSIDNMMGTGSLQTTGNPLDVAVQGDGFFQVGTGNPGTSTAPSAIQYTRAGNFSLNSQGYLMNQGGQYLVGVKATLNPDGTYSPAAPTNTAANQEYINIPAGSTNQAVGQDGAVTYTDNNPANTTTYGKTVTAGYMQLATFANEAGLTRDGGSMWSASQSSGAASLDIPGINGKGSTVSGTLEDSNVDLASEFSTMITAERGYEANSKVITTADQMLSTVVNMPQG
jgi:flagellar hook protein FlgE